MGRKPTLVRRRREASQRRRQERKEPEILNRLGLKLILAAAFLGLPCQASRAADPDQVLVLYNADWTDDLPGTGPGQDSEEVARHYVARHTDPGTGRKPYLLGLSCKHAKRAAPARHLSGEIIDEVRDNPFGIVYTGKGRPLSPQTLKTRPFYLLSSHVEVPVDTEAYDFDTVSLKAAPGGDEAGAKVLWADGACPLGQHLASVRETETRQGARTVKLKTLLVDARRAGFEGDVHVWVSAKGRNGQGDLKDEARFFDPANFAFSRTGPDGVRDDANWLEDVEQPVKAFLEDPARAVDGVLLKDRILYIVICYGLPRTVTRTHGIAQSAVPTSRRDSGHLVSFGQRLEAMYYDLESVRPPLIRPLRLNEKAGAFQAWAPVTLWWLPILGPGAQPYLHPAAYQDLKKRPELKLPWPYPSHFTPEERRRFPKRFLYQCSRIDAADPETAKYQVDAAVYATRYLTPRIGGPAQGEWDGTKALADSSETCGLEELQGLGFPGVGKAINRAVYFGRRDAGGYLPGAVDWFVISGNSLSGPTSHVNRMLHNRVTATGGPARAYSGCPHTTTHGWWDSQVFYHFLFRGYDLGEAWLLSRYKLLWSTCFIGDPLYRPDLRRTHLDTAPPVVAKADDVSVELVTAADRYAVVVRAALATTPENPEVVTAVLEYWTQGDPGNVRRVADPLFTGRPMVMLRELAPATTYVYRLALTDPYGNGFDSRQALGERTFRTGPALAAMKPAVEMKDPKKVWIGGEGRKDMLGPEAGEIELVFVAGKDDGYNLFWSADLRATQSRGRVTFNPGGGHWSTNAYRFEPGRTYRLRARYRKWPVTREVWLVAADGTEFLLCADNRSPWKPLRLGRELVCASSLKGGLVRHIAVYADSRPGSDAADPPPETFDAAAFDKADGWTPKPE